MEFVEGTWHCNVINQVLQTYEDPIYLEIGVRYATSFNNALPYCKEAHGVDIDEVSHTHMHGGTFYHMDSDIFFQQVELQPDVVFIDGEHTYDQVKKDFWSASKILNKGGTIIMHDTWPVLKENESACGTVHNFRDELETLWTNEYTCYTYRRFPGVTIAQRPLVSW